MIDAVHGEIRQALSNIVGNAIDAMSKQQNGTLHIRVSEVTGRNGKLVRVTVADTGAGIAPEHKKRIFEPFFTTKESVGTGLGLWVTRQLIKRNGGGIRVRSKVGGGTVFSLFFKVARRGQPRALRIAADYARPA